MFNIARLIIVSLLLANNCWGQSSMAIAANSYTQRAASVVAGAKNLPWKRFGVRVAVDTTVNVIMFKLLQRAEASFGRAINGVSTYISKTKNESEPQESEWEKAVRVLNFIAASDDVTSEALFADQTVKVWEHMTAALRDMALIAVFAKGSDYIHTFIDNKFLPTEAQPAISWKHSVAQRLTFLPLVVHFFATRSDQPNSTTSVGKLLGNAAKLTGTLAAILYVNEHIISPYFLGNQHQPLRGNRFGMRFAGMVLPKVIAGAFA